MSDIRKKNARTTMGSAKVDSELKVRVTKEEKRWLEAQSEKLGYSVAVTLRLALKAYAEQQAAEEAEAIGA